MTASSAALLATSGAIRDPGRRPGPLPPPASGPPSGSAPGSAPGPASRPASGTHPSGPAGRRPREAHRPGAATRPRSSPPGAGWLEELVAGFAQLYLEVECGRRPPRMARRLLDPRLAAQLEGRWVRRSGPPGQLVRVSGVRTSPDVVDAVAVVRRGDRTGAIAIRLVRRHGRWLVAEAARPEDGPPPALPYTFPADDADPLEELLDAAAARPLAAPAVPVPVEAVA